MEPIRALIIDDEKFVCEGCHMVLKKRGHSADVRMTGKEGVEALRTGNYEVILLDIRLPDMDGMEIMRTLKDQRPGECVIVITGYPSVETAVEAMKLGAYDYLPKPFSDDEFLIAVERAAEKTRLMQENRRLRNAILDRCSFSNIIGENPKILAIFEAIKKVAPADTTVLLCGESGTGKEIFARAIHAQSGRAVRAFVPMDCSTLASGLLESELFGHVRGAFTGAVQDKQGIFEAAKDGTLFLDDVANLNLEIQAKLLRVLESGEYKPVGSSQIKQTHVRIITATNKDLGEMVKNGSFREDLFYRLNVFPILLPPLRERRDDIPKLAYHFLRVFTRKTGKRIEGLTDDALRMLVNHDWPGNVRQLKNAIERLVIMVDQGIVDLLDLMDHIHLKQFLAGERIPENLEELNSVKRHLLKDTFGEIEKAFLMKALKESDGNITHAAAKVGMQRSNFSALMRKHRLFPKELNP
ncbi:MAG: sigma-54-dependent Fis family transcriptional regulator [Deltaproteobacteria bacterium]|nr:sigma-54-dependent Fis family transcriptional regulator [Deltaproteobacteria bacterium]